MKKTFAFKIFLKNHHHPTANNSLYIDLNNLHPNHHRENVLANEMDQLDNAVNNAGHDPRSQLINILGVRRFEKLATNQPFMTRVLDVAFVSIVIIWINLVGINNMMRLFRNHSLVSRLTEHEFTESVTPFLEIVGEDNFVHLMRNSFFVTRILNAEFNSLMHFWMGILGPEGFVRLVSNRGVLARLGNPDLQERLTRLYQGMPCFNEFMVGSSQVTDSVFVGYVEFLLLRLY